MARLTAASMGHPILVESRPDLMFRIAKAPGSAGMADAECQG